VYDIELLPPEGTRTKRGRQDDVAKVHAIANNFSTYKANLVKQFPDEEPNVKLHFAPTCPS
jgi:hypothetical protein